MPRRGKAFSYERGISVQGGASDVPNTLLLPRALGASHTVQHTQWAMWGGEIKWFWRDLGEVWVSILIINLLSMLYTYM